MPELSKQWQHPLLVVRQVEDQGKGAENEDWSQQHPQDYQHQANETARVAQNLLQFSIGA